MWKFIRFLNENYWQIYINGSRYVLKKINADKSTFTRCLVEMKGVEPLSVKASPKASTSLLSFRVSQKKLKTYKKFLC